MYLPTVDHIGISKRIGSDKERARLREAIEAMKPPQGGLIVRTVAEGLTKKQLKADVGYLVRLWGEVAKKRERRARRRRCSTSELDLVLKTARDLFTDDIEQDRHRRPRAVRAARAASSRCSCPSASRTIELYDGDEPIFDAYGIEDEIARALSRKVPLPSGGYLIIDQAEALTAIDVNTGRFVGKGSKDLEETILKTNLEAVEEIAYQLRFRNIGGLIILDLIDMERAQQPREGPPHARGAAQKDKAKTTLNRISRSRPHRDDAQAHAREPRPHCCTSRASTATAPGSCSRSRRSPTRSCARSGASATTCRATSVVVNAHPAVVDLLQGRREGAPCTEAEKRFMRQIELVPRKEYHLEQFDLQGK